MIKAKFKNLCPNCGGDIEAERLSKGLPCTTCLKYEVDNIYENLKDGELKEIYFLNLKVKDWEKFFEEHIKAKPWSLQITWAKRIFLNHSFALLAPTGIGKTTFGISMACYLANKSKKSYIILPTILLIQQVENRILNFGLNQNEILSFKDETKTKKEEKKKRLQAGDFKILITTSMFLYKNHQIIPKNFDFIFVDDVDSFLKTAKNIDKLLYLLSFSEKDIQMTTELINLRNKVNKSEDDIKKIEKISEHIKNITSSKKSVLVLSSATSSPKTKKIKLFRELLGFEVGTPIFYLRNIIDTYCDTEVTPLDEWIKLFGKGGIVFIPSDKGKEEVKKICKELNKKGIKAIEYEDISDENLKLYEKGEIQVLVGIASYRNPLARGLDMPHIVKYAIFYGVPKIVISLKFEKNINHLLWAVSSVRSCIVKNFPEYAQKTVKWLKELKKYKDIKEEYIEKNTRLKSIIENLKKEITEFLTSQEVIKVINDSEDITIKKINNEYIMTISDITGYLQASGRTSRLYAGGITKGISLVIIDEKKAFNHLIKKVKFYNDEIEFKKIEELNIKEILKEVENDRKKIKEYIQGIFNPELKELLKPLLIIVESPNKAKTIANFFGKAIRRKILETDVLETSIEDKYIMITASLGHILDLNKEEGFYGVKISGGIKPVYEPIEGKEKIIQSLKRMAIESEEILIATDPDTEGEKIAWDLMEILKPITDNIKRMEFHEVTKRAILKAIKEPRDFDLNLVKAQIVRRILDRWIGFEFSEYLQSSFNISHLSAGRVQTPVLGWIIDRQKEFLKKIYKIIVYVDEKKKFKVEFKFENLTEAKKFYNDLNSLNIKLTDQEEETKNPSPPYRTDTLLKDAADKYKFSLPKTMQLAQELFEFGFITYHRTDSIRVSDYGIYIAKEYIRSVFGENYFYARTWAEGGAHECIRPTKSIDPEELKSMVLTGEIENLTEAHLLLYSLIFKRFIASQMKPAKVKKVKLTMDALDKKIEIEHNTEIIEDGWNKILPLETIPLITGNTDVSQKKFFKISPKAYPYTHGEIVQEMKEKGIGRPSTYATIIEKLLERKYVIEKNGYIYPTNLGKKVYFYLNKKQQARNFLSEEFTKQLEEFMDKVEIGKMNYEEILSNMYSNLKRIKRYLFSKKFKIY